MNRSKLLEYLDQGSDVRHLFAPEEFGYPILFAYSNIRWAVRDRCKSIRVTSDAVLALQCAQDTEPFTTIIDLRPSFDLVLRRDSVVRSHLRLLNRTADSVEYELQVEDDEQK